MSLIDDLLASALEGEVLDVRIGLHWTAVVAEVAGQRRCGLASTLQGPSDHTGEPDIPEAGRLATYSGLELASLLRSESPLQRSVGGAALNALLPRQVGEWPAQNAEQVIASLGAGKTIAIVGRFPFARRIGHLAKELLVLERDPRPGELPEAAAADVIPRADLLAITGMTLLNHTLEQLLALAAPGATVLVVGPTTPLSPILFEYGAHMLSGSVVTNIEAVIGAVSQGANFRQVHKAGVRLATLRRHDRLKRQGSG